MTLTSRLRSPGSNRRRSILSMVIVAAYRVIEAAEELDQSRFPRAILTHQGHYLARQNLETDILQYHSLPGGIMEIDPIQENPFLDRAGKRRCRRRLHEFRLEIEELVKVGEKEVVLVKAGQAGPDFLKRPLGPLKGPVVHNHIPEGDCPLYWSGRQQKPAPRKSPRWHWPG